MKIPFIKPSVAAHILRGVVAIAFIIHGSTRAYEGTVGGFGEFLDSKGFPLGVVIAWAITLFEMAGGIILLLGKFKRPIALIFIWNLVWGIILVHAANGWFVVGKNNGGIEYSVLLIAALLVIAASDETYVQQ